MDSCICTFKTKTYAVVTTGRTCNVHLSTADFVEKFYVARTFFSDTHGAGTARRRFLQYLSYSHIKTVGIAELAYGRRKLRGTHVPRSLRSVVTTALLTVLVPHISTLIIIFFYIDEGDFNEQL